MTEKSKLEIKSAIHKKGDPYPEHRHGGLQGWVSITELMYTSKEHFKIQLDKIYSVSNATEVNYFYAEPVEE